MLERENMPFQKGFLRLRAERDMERLVRVRGLQRRPEVKPPYGRGRRTADRGSGGRRMRTMSVS